VAVWLWFTKKEHDGPKVFVEEKKNSATHVLLACFMLQVDTCELGSFQPV
jgi:hypothetical protein